MVAHATPVLAPVDPGLELAAQLKPNLQAPLVVQLDPLADVLNLALPVAFLEAAPGTVGEAPELPVVAFESLVDEPRATRDVELPVCHRPAYIIAIMIRPNSEHDTRLAPSMSRAKS